MLNIRSKCSNKESHSLNMESAPELFALTIEPKGQYTELLLSIFSLSSLCMAGKSGIWTPLISDFKMCAMKPPLSLQWLPKQRQFSSRTRSWLGNEYFYYFRWRIVKVAEHILQSCLLCFHVSMYYKNYIKHNYNVTG